MPGSNKPMNSWIYVLLVLVGAFLWAKSLITSNAEESDWFELSCPIKSGKVVLYSYSKNLNAVDVDGIVANDVVFQNRLIVFSAPLQDGLVYHHILNLEDRTLRIQTRNRKKTMPLIKCNMKADTGLKSRMHRTHELN